MVAKPSIALGIHGLVMFPLRQIVDERGAVLQMMRSDAPEFQSFGECYFSEINPSAVKGWKRHRRQTQNISVPVGRVRFVVVDPRDDSPSKGAIEVVELGRPDCYARLRIPPLLWYGFSCIHALPSLVANCADLPHDPAESESMSLELSPWADALELLRHGRTAA